MIRPILTVSTGTLASRLLGFARDAMVAALLGTGPVADAFLVAFQGISVLRRSVTEGALNTSLVPAYLRIREHDGAVAAAAFAGRVLGSVSLAMIVAATLIGLAMPLVITALAPGFTGHPTLQLAVDNARLMLPYLAFAGPVAVMMGLLNAQHRFVLTAFSPILFNVALIGVMIALLAWRQDAADAALVMAATVGIAGLLQLLMLTLRVDGEKLAAPLKVSFDAGMRSFFLRGLAGLLANSGPQLLIVGGAIIGSSTPSVVSWLYFANRLIELPLGIVGTAMGTVLVPELTRAVSGDDKAALMQAESRALELAVGLALPAALGLIVLCRPIVHVLFEHGAFDAADTVQTARALALLALGLPAHVLVKALSPAFFARGDTTTPLFAALKGFAVAIVLAIVLGQIAGAGGIAAGIALGAWSNALALIRQGAATFGFSIDTAARRRLPRIVAAALAMGGVLWAAAAFAPTLVENPHSLAQAAILGILIVGAVATYGLLLNLFGAVNWADAARALRPSPPRDLRA
jgi:putative peptidoglycan lipid II flippase